ncbi:GntR family transcriptional regulator [Paracoccus sp. M683]|uniref:GntR family transcriptional regulator n=1 Tax=Paracoccus sp. M683 TaxID=2594268 RepID=UPI0011812E34|nr:GntR family transcriptional regulator [Paracoccus sp. M683]TRW99137.1 GntR family transcriptional regulator [Paracoccus sp. M683]
MAGSELATRISNRLAQDILTGTIERGARVGTQQIADRYQVSRTPVRDALALLEQAGFLQREPNRGYFVMEQIPQSAIDSASAQASDDHEEYQRLAEDWLTDQLSENVTEQSLRQRYGITKSRLNDILARAAREGWAERKEGYGWRLLPVAKTAEAFDQIYRFRMTIEPAAMLEPGFEINRRALDEQRRIQESMLDCDIARIPAERLLANGAEFHEELIRMSGNPFYVSALERVNRMRRLMEYRARVDRQRVLVQSSQHLEIIALLERGEVVEASYFLRRHLSDALQRKLPMAWSWSSEVRADPPTLR